MVSDNYSNPLPKRRKLADLPDEVAPTGPPESISGTSKSLERPISPPLRRRKSPALLLGADDVAPQASPLPFRALDSARAFEQETAKHGHERFISSPVQLTRIQDLAPWQNVDTVGLGDLLGDPMIRECWCFNYLFDLGFVMKHFDHDTRDIVKVKIVHGFWKRDDERRIALMETAEQFPNMEILSAYIPDPFGTHHSKMLILFRHDGLAQVIIHTANMIPKDWTNMTQAVWRSPLLPLLPQLPTSSSADIHYPIGSGERFKVDLLRYLNKYEKRVSGLPKQLADYDFHAVRAAFVGSAPSRQDPSTTQPERHTSFGWLGLQEILSEVPVSSEGKAPHIVTQISSIATLGAAPTWLTNFHSVLSRHSAVQNGPEVGSTSTSPDAKFSVVFPTPEEIRTSLDGYKSGGSIHMKLQSTQQQKQLEYLKPLLCHWKHSPTTTPTSSHSSTSESSHDVDSPPFGRALRGPAAPHIKTYMRFSNDEHKTIDWAMLTSANLSKQAWGDVVNKKGEVWVQSWETGVVIWPALFAEDAVMVPTFGQDMPTQQEKIDKGEHAEESSEARHASKNKTVVGFRMPYDLPLSPYAAEDMPWCATMQYQDLDWKGCAWGGW
ncbi:phospholipase D/nuclease [Dothidotthia symphoricarpi CBS 119687]|uniref:Phospholipase D/nuclease n=1 Tax=Dothidotthia symphoricarpi CBS 119687 TaxID=1392245 RepID=A0A6A6A1N6_9PLEO|nr:phospholipase D/nuclease [Dothidotthia symphoricarpi CBS 119687]KAF2125074.1 phospholipase D/nuclease [Dothidotthia symphoricarpi CBS 119687]